MLRERTCRCGRRVDLSYSRCVRCGAPWPQAQAPTPSAPAAPAPAQTPAPLPQETGWPGRCARGHQSWRLLRKVGRREDLVCSGVVGGRPCGIRISVGGRSQGFLSEGRVSAAPLATLRTVMQALGSELDPQAVREIQRATRLSLGQTRGAVGRAEARGLIEKLEPSPQPWGSAATSYKLTALGWRWLSWDAAERADGATRAALTH